jgi:type IV pilus assembly protein PilQ
MNSATVSREFAGASPFNTNLNIGVLDMFGDLNAALTLAERDSLAKVISSPRISSMNREKSTIKQEGENVTIISTRSEQSGVVTKTEKRTPFSLELSVTPQITADGGVIMDLDVRREFLGPLVDVETGARAINKRSAKTKVMVRNGQTTVIGGIYTSDELEASNGIPGLKNIPILGWLFKSKSFGRTKNELLIFLTPRILSQDIGTEVAAATPISDSPADFGDDGTGSEFE